MNYVGARNARIIAQNAAQSGEPADDPRTEDIEQPSVSQLAHFFGGGMTNGF